MWGDYYITKEEDENTGYPVDESSIQPCFEELPNGSQFASLLQEANEKDHSFPIVGLQFCADEYMTAAGYARMISLLDSDTFEPIQVDGSGYTCSCFLISEKLHSELDVAEINDLRSFIQSILDDTEKETPDGEYTWCGHCVYLGYL